MNAEIYNLMKRYSEEYKVNFDLATQISCDVHSLDVLWLYDRANWVSLYNQMLDTLKVKAWSKKISSSKKQKKT